jgi:hypothetical protein
MVGLRLCEGMRICTNSNRENCIHAWTHYPHHIGDECTEQPCEVKLIQTPGIIGMDGEYDVPPVYTRIQCRCIPYHDGLEKELPCCLSEWEVYRESR